MTSDARRPGPSTPVADSNAAPQHGNGSHLTPHLGRLTWNGHGGLTSIYAKRRGWLDDVDLRRLLRDTEGAALALFDAIGPLEARRLARELLRLSEEVA